MRKQLGNVASDESIVHGLEGLIGDTPLVKIRSLSAKTGCIILVSNCMENWDKSADEWTQG